MKALEDQESTRSNRQNRWENDRNRRELECNDQILREVTKNKKRKVRHLSKASKRTCGTLTEARRR